MNDNTQEKNNFWREVVKLLLLAALVVVPFRMLVAQPFIVDGASMDPTFKNNQYLIVDQLSYRFKDPERGSVLIFKYPKDPSKYFIKRVIGLPGETVRIHRGQVTIINSEHPQGLVLEEPYVVFAKDDSSTFTLSNSEYFVMGDNRLGSADSRLWGPVSRDEVIGRPIVRLYPTDIFPGDETDLFAETKDNNENN